MSLEYLNHFKDSLASFVRSVNDEELRINKDRNESERLSNKRETLQEEVLKLEKLREDQGILLKEQEQDHESVLVSKKQEAGLILKDAHDLLADAKRQRGLANDNREQSEVLLEQSTKDKEFWQKKKADLNVVMGVGA